MKGSYIIESGYRAAETGITLSDVTTPPGRSSGASIR